MMVINDRMKDILNAVVHYYIMTAEPISSEAIVSHYGLQVSSATVRHDMLALEKLGFLKKPHTSAGRVPTDKGYRFYVDRLMSKKLVNLSKEEKQEIIREYKIRRDFNEIMRITSKLISRLTNNLGVVLAPNMVSEVLENIHFIALDPNRILVTLVTNTGLFYQKIMRTNCEISEENLEAIARIIKQEFYGKSLEVVSEDMLDSI